MKNKAKLLLAAVAALMVGLVYWAVVTTPDASAPDEPSKESRMMQYTGNTISEERNGVKIWEMTAEEILVDTETQDLTLKNLSGKFYQADGKIVNIKALEGFYQAKEKNIKMDGGVNVESSDGAKLEAKRLLWQSATGTLTGEENVKLTKDETVAVADKMESSDGFDIVKLIGHAHITKGKVQ